MKKVLLILGLILCFPLASWGQSNIITLDNATVADLHDDVQIWMADSTGATWDRGVLISRLLQAITESSGSFAMRLLDSAAVDTEAEFEAVLFSLITAGDIDTSAELKAILTDEQGTGGSVVFSTGPTLTNALLSGASLQGNLDLAGFGFTDVNGNLILNFEAIASATKYVEIGNAFTGSPKITVDGVDTDITLRIFGKGTGGVEFGDATFLLLPDGTSNPTTSGHIYYNTSTHTLQWGANGSAKQGVSLDDTQTLTNKTLTSPTLDTPTLNLSQTTSPTAEGRLAWDATNDELEAGDGASTKIFKPVGTFTDEALCTAESTGNQVDCDITMNGRDTALEADTTFLLVWDAKTAAHTYIEMDSLAHAMRDSASVAMVDQSENVSAQWTFNKGFQSTFLDITANIIEGGANPDTVAWDWSQANNFTVTLNEDTFIKNPTNIGQGGYALRVCQPVGGNLAITNYDTAFNNFSPIHEGANECTTLSFTSYNGTDVDVGSDRGEKCEPVVIGAKDTDLAVTDSTAFHIPRQWTITNLFAGVKVAPAGGGNATFDIDIQDGATTSILSTLLTIDDAENTTNTAATPFVFATDHTLAAYSQLVVDVTDVGDTTAGQELTAWICYVD